MKIEEHNGEFIVTDFNAFEAYRIACKIEQDGLWFYRKIKEKTDNAEVQKALGFLIQEEQEHLNFFEDQLEQLREAGEDVSEENDLLASIDYGVFQPYQSMPHLEEKLRDVAMALKLGIVAEEKSISFYQLCKNYVASEEVKAVLQKIIAEEAKHKAHIQEMIEKMT